MRCLSVLLLLAPSLFAAEDPVLKAMHDELQRSMTLHFNSLDKPYYLEYMMEDGYRLQISAMLGGIVSQDQSQFRIPRLRLRIGTPQFDNTNYAAGRGSYSMRMAGTFPLDDDYAAIRHAFWLSTDQAYKAALETISRKHAALKNISVPEELPDFSAAPQAKIILDFKPAKIDPQPWASHVKAISAEFLKFPELRESSVDYSVEDGARRLVTSEGGELHLPAQECELRMQATAQAKDGMTVRDSALFESLGLDGIPSRETLIKIADDLGATVSALAKAPRGDDYSGPVIFDGIASAQLMAELLGRNLAMTRRPVVDSGAGGGVGGVPASELEGRIGVRILPESFWVRDDPTLKEWKGHHLFGTMKVDEDGVEAKPLSIIEKGVLKTVFLTRQPVRGFPATNARARLQGPYGSSSAAATNLIVESKEVVAKADLKSKMIDMLKQRDKPFGYIVRKMDFPSSASGGEVRRLIMAAARSGGSRPISLPLRIYRVYQDGHEEMVRGLRFRALNVRSLKDIVAAADDTNVLNYPENGQPFSMLGGGGETAETSVIAPSLLIDDLELTPTEEEQPKLPIVPAPPLSIAMWDRLQPVRAAQPPAVASPAALPPTLPSGPAAAASARNTDFSLSASAKRKQKTSFLSSDSRLPTP